MPAYQQFKKIFQVTVAWTLLSLLNYFIGIGAIVDANFISNANYDIGEIDHWHGIYVSLLTGVLSGLLGGTIMVFIWEKWLRSKPYGWTLRNIIISYVILFNFVAVPIILFNNSYQKPFGLLSQ